MLTFNKEARELYLKFAMAPDAMWRANFRDLSASVTRMATLAPLGRINEEAVRDEIDRLMILWRAGDASDREAILLDVLGPDRQSQIDMFDRAQLAAVLEVCRNSKSISAAGRKLFAVSRLQKTSGNDADRLRKYLMRFDLNFEDIAGR